MKGKEFLDFAQKIFHFRSEAAIRSAVSRVYCAAFNTGKTLLNGLGFVLPKDAAAHEELYRRLYNSGLPEIQETASWLFDMRRKRISADYDMLSHDFQSHKSYELDIARAKLTIAQLESYSKPPLRNQLKDGIQEYERKIGLH
ncbi:MAG: hypothetical protein ACREOI_10165 [bacterium]